MKRTWLLFSIATMVLTASVGSAQPLAPPAAKIDSQANQEDIEVMRRLLNQLMNPHQESWQTSLIPFLHSGSSNFNTLYSNSNQVSPQNQAVNNGLLWLQDYTNAPTSIVGNNTAMNNNGIADLYVANSARPSPKITFEGNYLKGHGINFTATVNPTEPVWFQPGSNALGVTTCATCHGQPMHSQARPEPAPLTAWEKTRRELIGTSQKAPAPVRIGQTCQPGNATEAILDLLAENGHHFKQLPANENLSVALTIHSNRLVAALQDITQPNTSSKTFLAKVQDLKALGELHLKQKKWNEAADTFRDAIKTMHLVPASKKDDDAQNIDRKREIRYLNLKLIVALTSAGRDAEAESLVKSLAEGTTVVPTPEAKANPEPESKVILPAKLIITVSKQLLADVHSKKITLEQFKKSAEIEAIGFPAADKKK